ncbi:SAM-dependent methyltransferase [Filimonas zeae]|uniref:Methyltransferase domain-containing protein n=1 Tax=Filimonas zeae TaxID=1737353 RepID=A0A917MTL4_9BACT|nr:class I SAM-dependent methyltransferase [Filimonas zeae]MDR6339558.1 SAM-dependent methyltransferase [Filimonas zeae]GGH63057.1 hypothetical protein GCM10011379_13530 [Filimonas zeae]
MFCKTTSTTDNAAKWFQSDFRFHQLYPADMRRLASQHWTPLQVVKQATDYLADRAGVRILDIGSGIGKFCLSGAWLQPGATFYGVEQRDNLIGYAQAAQHALGLQNVHFYHGNFTQLNLSDYHHFYCFNPFYENLKNTDKIDDTIAFSAELYHYYNRFLHRQLEYMPVGTRVVTFHSLGNEIPASYQLADVWMDDMLKFWMKYK